LLQQHKDLLIAKITGLPPAAFARLVASVNDGAYARLVPLASTFSAMVTALVDGAELEGWIIALVAKLTTSYPGVTEFGIIHRQLENEILPMTTPNPFDEVLLEGGRPFVNRRDLRAALSDLVEDAGAPVLMVDGAPLSGKTYSYYLINHVGPGRRFLVSRFKMSTLPNPGELAGEIMQRIGDERQLFGQGPESAQRWAEKLAHQIANAILDRKIKRLFVFDDFSDAALPDGTESLILRLATYADEELRPYLRLVMIRFRNELPTDIEDVALRESTKAFTATDMIATVMQIAAARGWSITEAAVKERIDQFHGGTERTLKERFSFLKQLIRQLSAASPRGAG
jgi:hypothetical protein